MFLFDVTFFPPDTNTNLNNAASMAVPKASKTRRDSPKFAFPYLRMLKAAMKMQSQDVIVLRMPYMKFSAPMAPTIQQKAFHRASSALSL